MISENLFEIINSSDNIVSIAPADGRALSGARPSAGTVMTTFESATYT